MDADLEEFAKPAEKVRSSLDPVALEEFCKELERLEGLKPDDRERELSNLRPLLPDPIKQARELRKSYTHPNEWKFMRHALGLRDTEELAVAHRVEAARLSQQSVSNSGELNMLQIVSGLFARNRGQWTLKELEQLTGLIEDERRWAISKTAELQALSFSDLRRESKSAERPRF